MRRALPLFLFLTLLVWGLFAFDRGLFHDDAAALAWAQVRAARFPWGLFEPFNGPTRLLFGTPFALAWASPEPAAVLQGLLGASWLAAGLAARALYKRAFSSGEGAALVAGAVALTATSDALSCSSAALGYVYGGALLAAALSAAVRYLDDGRRRALAVAAFLLAAGLFSADALAPAAALGPLVFLAARGRADRRWATAAGVWWLACLPYAALFARFLADPGGYAAVAIAPFDAARQARLTAALTAHGFMPWRWAFRTPVLFESLPPVVPAWVYVLAAAAAGAAFLAAARASGAASGKPAGGDCRARDLRVAAALAVLVVATHAAFSGVQLAEARFRTHLVTRLLTSLLVALAAEALARRLRPPHLALALPAAFVALGTVGGIERQDTFLETWARHRAELASTLSEVPALAPGATLVLSLRPDPGGLQATRVPYLAGAWMSLLRDDATVAPRTVVDLPGWGTDCAPTATGLSCTDRSGVRLLPWGDVVLLRFDAEAFRYRLVEDLPVAGGAYRPHALVRSGAPSSRARALLQGPRFLGRFVSLADS